MNDLQGDNKDEFTIGTAHRMTILKNTPPSELAAIVENEPAKGSLMTLHLLRAYVVNQSRLAYALEQGAAPDIVPKFVDQPNQQRQPTNSRWVACSKPMEHRPNLSSPPSNVSSGSWRKKVFISTPRTLKTNRYHKQSYL